MGIYSSARWKKLRLKCFVRDHWICQRSGVACIGGKNAPDSAVANHIIPHKGDPKLFWDLDNLETVTKEVHDSLIRKEELNGYRVGTDRNGLPVDPGHPWNRGGGEG